MLESLIFVDKVIALPDRMKDEDYAKLVMKLKPNIVAVTKGDPILKKKKAHAAHVGAEVIEIPKIRVSSTTQIAKLLGLD